MTRVALGVAVAATLAGCAVGPVQTLTDGRVGTVAFESLTLTGQQFRQGDRNGTPVVITGELVLPVPAAGPVPAMVLIHGSGGIGGAERSWARELRALGLATFTVDSFTGRGATQTVDDQSRVVSESMTVDAYRALALLATHPRIDASRIALMGFSEGGIVTRIALLRRAQRAHGPAGFEFAAYLPFYAYCNPRYREDTVVTDRPIRFFHGEADDWTPAASCREYVARLRAAGKDAEITVYPGVRHSFDNVQRAGQGVGWSPWAVNFAGCFAEEQADGQMVNRETGRPVTAGDACVTRGATTAYDHRPAGDGAHPAHLPAGPVSWAVSGLAVTSLRLDSSGKCARHVGPSKPSTGLPR